MGRGQGSALANTSSDGSSRVSGWCLGSRDRREPTCAASKFLLTVALAAMGLETDIRKLRARGLRPLALGAGAWLFISGFSLALIELVY